MDTPSAPTRSRAAAVQVRLLGGLDVDCGALRLQRLPSRAVAALLARLALWPDRMHAREELVELLWPGVDLATGRNRLRQALSTLKSLIEPTGGPAVISADRMGLRVTPGALACDVREFETLARAGRAQDACALYVGELMPGHYDDWVQVERQRLAALHERVGLQVAPAATAQTAPPAERVPLALAGIPPLPAYLTRYFGADGQGARLRGLLLAHRLVTMLGPGGSGKTRLAVELAGALRDTPDFAQTESAGPSFDTVAFVPLVACNDAAQVLAAIGDALRLPVQAQANASALAQALAGRRTLLVLDNFEQLVDGAAFLVADLLARASALHLLVTSRRALGLDGEREFVLEPLPLLALDAPLAQAAENAAVALFVDRARAVRADFHLSARNAQPIAALVHALEGMPLAIELAASRVRSISPQEMLAAFGAGDAARAPATLDLLARSGPRAGLDARHASMRRVIEWSWQQLTVEQARLLAQLTVFDGSFSIGAASAVHGEGAALRIDELASQSMLRAHAGSDNDEGGSRFSLYEPIREFAAERLAPDERAALRSRLRAWLIAWASALGTHAAPSAVEAEMPNIRAAMLGARADGEPRRGLQLLLALRAHWDTDGMPVAQVADLEAALQAVARSKGAAGTAIRALRADAHELLSYLRFEAGFADEAQTHAEASLHCAGADPSRRARALVRRAWVQIARQRTGADALPALSEALALAESCADREAQARALHQLAIVELEAQHAGAADDLLARSQALWEQLGDRRKAMARLRNRAQVMHHQKRTPEAMAIFEQTEQAAREEGDWVGLIDSTLSQGVARADLHDWAGAAQALAPCVALCWQRHHMHSLAYALWNLARVLARLRRPEAAARLMAAAEQLWVTRYGPLSPNDERYARVVRALVRAQLGAARTQALWAQGCALELAETVALARQAAQA